MSSWKSKALCRWFAFSLCTGLLLARLSSHDDVLTYVSVIQEDLQEANKPESGPRSRDHLVTHHPFLCPAEMLTRPIYITQDERPEAFETNDRTDVVRIFLPASPDSGLSVVRIATRSSRLDGLPVVPLTPLRSFHVSQSCRSLLAGSQYSLGPVALPVDTPFALLAWIHGFPVASPWAYPEIQTLYRRLPS